MSQGYLSLVLHAHLPYVRHPEHDRFLEENWLFEAVAETYLPLLEVLEGWRQQEVKVRLTLTLSPTLCAMLLDPLLQQRCARYLEELGTLAEKEIHRTRWQPGFHELALFYDERFRKLLLLYEHWQRDLVRAFRSYQESGFLEIITTAATHAVLPLLGTDGRAVRAQLLVARDFYHACFGRPPSGIWLPECGYAERIEPYLQEAGLRWFILDTHGLLYSRPRPRFASFAPILSARARLAAFGRDMDSARQVWSRHEGYPGDPRYRDFYRDVGYDADYDYVRGYLPAPEKRTFTGLKYHRVGQGAVYDRKAALEAVDTHATHFLAARVQQVKQAAALMPLAPILVCPYDAELFGHWWYEGPEFLDLLARKAFYDQSALAMVTPGDYLQQQSELQVVTPAESSWGEGGYWRMWLNEKTEWIYRHLRPAEERMTLLARQFSAPAPLVARALKQAARELLLAQSSDWPFILSSGTSPDYARRRVERHLVRFNQLYDQITRRTVDAEALGLMEYQDSLFPEIDYAYWR